MGKKLSGKGLRNIIILFNVSEIKIAKAYLISNFIVNFAKCFVLEGLFVVER